MFRFSEAFHRGILAISFQIISLLKERLISPRIELKEDFYILNLKNKLKKIFKKDPYIPSPRFNNYQDFITFALYLSLFAEIF